MGSSRRETQTNIFGRSVTPANVLAFPGLNTLGISMNRVDFAPGGLNPPPSHPRATETGVVIEGKLLGSCHSQLNVGEENALLFTAFNSHLPGSAIVPTTLFVSNLNSR
uniref:Cupin type-1 domain-containing protein n=1 Tax=Populus alba TaxID=43335 RepID=A0A4U5MI64_POPAL|nr:hypothetical protein D5086_0000309880 [Populus alba]